MKTYKVSLHVKTEITAADTEEASATFWDALHRAAAEEELAQIEEVK